MNTQPKSTLRSTPLICRVSGYLILLLFLSLLAGSSPAQVTNRFSDGEGDTSTDQFPGMAGDGWAEPWNWQFGVNSGFSGYFGVDPHVLTASPLSGGGNYLNWAMANSESSMRRKYVVTANLNVALGHIIEWDLRMDGWLPNTNTFTSGSDGVSICTRRTLGTDVGGNATFWIRAQGGADSGAPFATNKWWNFYSGGISSSSDASGLFTNSAGVVPFAMNRTYHFKVLLDPPTKTYIGSVSDGTNTFTTGSLRYKSYSDNNFNNISNSTIFQVVSRTSARVDTNTTATETNIISLDNIKIYVDPNVIAPIITQLTPPAAASFYPAVSNLVFDATTIGPANNLPASGITLTLNGVNVSGVLTLSGTDASTNRTITYSALTDNTVYAGTIAVKDQAGHGTTNSFFFDTFVDTNVIVIEAENYNFETSSNSCAGSTRTNFNSDGYLQNPLPSGLDTINGGYINEVDGYADRAGVPGVDYADVSATVNFSEFRICDTLDTRGKPGAEYLRPAFTTYGVNDYVWEHVEAGDWGNYTRVYSNSNYYVFLRGGARNRTYHYQLARVTSDRTQPNQTTAPVGIFTIPQLPARETLMNQPLTDAFGTPVLLRLNGEQTLRLTSLDASANDDTYVNYMVLMPAPGAAAAPFVYEYYPTSNESNIPPQSPIRITLANGSAPISVGTIVLNVNGTNVTSSASIAATAGGATINYLPALFFRRFSWNTVQLIYGDGSSALQTNQWAFHVGGYLPGTPIKVRFQQPASTNYPGYLPDTSLSFANRGNGFSYGWDRNFSEDTRQSFPAVTNAPNTCPAPDGRYGTFTHLNKASPPRIFEISIPNGNYGVYAVSGDPTAIDSIYKITVEGVLVVDGAPFHPQQWVEGSNAVTIADGRLTLTTGGPNGSFDGGNNNKINFIDITPLDYSPPDLTLRNPTVTGSTFSFTISSINRALHVIEYKNAITDPSWTTLTNVIGTGAIISVTDTVVGNRIYRMRIP